LAVARPAGGTILELPTAEALQPVSSKRRTSIAMSSFAARFGRRAAR